MIKKTITKEEVVETWRLNKGIGTVYYSNVDDYLWMVSYIVASIYNKQRSISVVVTVPKFDDRSVLLEAIREKLDYTGKDNFSYAYSSNFFAVYTNQFASRYAGEYRKKVFIAVNPTSVNEKFAEGLTNAKFKFCLLSSFSMNNEDKVRLYKACPLLTAIGGDTTVADKMSFPVEEEQIGVSISSRDTLEVLAKCDDYIATSMNIFGTFDMMSQARLGNSALNISAATICQRIAEDNGWNEHLDMNVPINRQLDEMYNPIALKDRSKITYDVIRSRSNILTDAPDKMEPIAKIVSKAIKNNDKVLIINKRGEFAAKVTEYINNVLGEIVCGDYHDHLNPIPATDENGEPIYYKSGVNAGKRKSFGAQAQSNNNLRKYNSGSLYALSMSGAPNKELACCVDIIIITSPACNTLEEYGYRLTKVEYTSNPIKLYTIYCKDTAEAKQLERLNLDNKHKIVNKNEISTNYDENVGVVFVD